MGWFFSWYLFFLGDLYRPINMYNIRILKQCSMQSFFVCECFSAPYKTTYSMKYWSAEWMKQASKQTRWTKTGCSLNQRLTKGQNAQTWWSWSYFSLLPWMIVIMSARKIRKLAKSRCFFRTKFLNANGCIVAPLWHPPGFPPNFQFISQRKRCKHPGFLLNA